MRSWRIDAFMVEMISDIWVTTVETAEISVATVCDPWMLGDAVLLMADWTDLASWTVLVIVLYDGAAGAVESRGWWGKSTFGNLGWEIG